MDTTSYSRTRTLFAYPNFVQRNSRVPRQAGGTNEAYGDDASNFRDTSNFRDHQSGGGYHGRSDLHLVLAGGRGGAERYGVDHIIYWRARGRCQSLTPNV